MRHVIIWNTGLIALIVGVVEFLFGGWLDSVTSPGLWRLSIYRNVEWTFDVADKYDRTEPTLYRRDRFGLRGNYGEPTQIDILTLGGSATDERFVSEGRTWSDMLGQCLKENGRPMRVANAGVAGQTTFGHIQNFKSWFPYVPGLKPRHLVVYVGINDLTIDTAGEKVDGGGAYDDPTRYMESKGRLWVERLKLNSALYALYRAALGNYTAWRAGYHHAQGKVAGESSLAGGVDRLWRESSGAKVSVDSNDHVLRLADYNSALSKQLDAYKKRLVRLIAEGRHMGAKVVFVTQAGGLYRLADGIVLGQLDFYFRLRAYNDATMDICAKAGLHCFDLAGVLEAQDGDFYDAVHTTEQGSRRIGEAICQWFVGNRSALSATPERYWW
jgi:hypothetical protein